MKSAMVVMLCLAFAIRTSGQTTTTYDTGIGHGTPPIPTVQFEVPNTLPAVVITSDYYAQPKVLVLHALNNSGKDITNASVPNASAIMAGLPPRWRGSRAVEATEHVRYDCLVLVVRSGVPRSNRVGRTDDLAGIQKGARGAIMTDIIGPKARDREAYIQAMWLLFLFEPSRPDPEPDGFYNLGEIGSAANKKLEQSDTVFTN